MISVTVTTRKAVGVPISDITVGAVGIPVVFTFSEDWDGLSKIAVFKAGSTSYDMAVVNDTTTVPAEVLTTAYDRLWIGVYGANGSGTVVIPTIWADTGVIKPGVELSGVNPADPTPNWAAQVQAYAAEAHNIASTIAPVEDATTAGRSYATGEYFLYNNKLYRATADIEIGGTITIGTNAVETTIAGELARLLS